MNMGKAHGPLVRGLLGPTPGIFVMSLLLALPVAIYSAWYPARATMLITLAMAYVAIGFPAWLITRVRRFVVKQYRQPASLLDADRDAHRRSRLLFAAIALILVMRLPFLATFGVSYFFLDGLAERHYAHMPMGSASGPVGRFVGLFYVESIWVAPSGVLIELPTGTTLRYRQSPPSFWYGRGHIFGNWYDGD